MSENYHPSSITDLTDLTDFIGDHIVMEKSIDIRTNGSLIKLGQTMQTSSVLSLSSFDQIKLYEPEELVITLGPGVNLRALKDTLAAKNQELRFEPPDYGPLLGFKKNQGSIGGIIGCNLSGPKRLIAGAARDFVLGIEGVSGYGQLFKAGGRVVKNVSGYDVSKLMTGSYGTLAALTEFTLKLTPKADAEISIIVFGLTDSDAISLMSEIARSPIGTTGLAHLPNDIAKTIIRIEGVNVAIKECTNSILKIVGLNPYEIYDREQSQDIWQHIRDVEPLNPPKEVPLWKVSVPATMAADLIEANNPEFYYFDWAGGLVWMSSHEVPKIKSGAFWLIRNASNSARKYPFTNEKEPAIKMIMERVKKSFDPKGIFNPNRLGD